jgi:hypothetical protein
VKPHRVVPFALLLAAVAPLAAQAPRTLVVGRPATDSLTARDPVRRSGKAPYHVWTFEGRRGQRLSADLVSSDFDAYLIVRDPDGFTLGSDDDSGDDLNARLHLILARDGTYRIIATATGGDSIRGRYTLSLAGWETPPAPAPGQAAAIAVGETKTGVLEPGDETSPDGPYQDRWTVQLRPGARLRAELRSRDLDAWLAVLDPDGRVLASDDDGLGGRDATVNFRAAAAGRYTLLASSFGEELRAGAYDLSLAEETGDFPDAGKSVAIRLGETRSGRLESGDVTGSRGLEDRWTFEGRAGDVVRLDAASADFDAYLVLRLDAMVVDSNDDGGGDRNARLLAVLPSTGTYTAAVSSFSDSRGGGRYTLTVAGLSAPAARGRTARIAVGQRLAGRLEHGDQAREEGGVLDEWEFDGTEGEDVTIELRSPAFDTYLELRSPGGDLVAENDDGFGEGTDSFISAHLPRAGRYRIVARGYGETEATGLYELALGAATPPAPPGRVVEVRLGETYTGRLEPGDSAMGDSSYADVFLFRPAWSGQVLFQLRSSDFDAYLLLQDADGRTLASDDDGGSGTDSQLTFEVVAGRAYRVVANSYGEERSTGLYRLTVRSGR